MQNKNEIIKEAIERMPFATIMSKRASGVLPVDYDHDFTYFYFSSRVESWCELRRGEVCTGTQNAKAHFPDYERIFSDDVTVMQEHTNHRVKIFCEPWHPKGLKSALNFVYAQKSGFSSEGLNYMLCTFALIDDVIVGTSGAKPMIVEYDARMELSFVRESHIHCNGLQTLLRILILE